MYKRTYGSSRSRFSQRRSNVNNHSRGRRIKSFSDVSKFINKAIVVEEEPDYVAKKEFVDFDINSTLKQNIVLKGYGSPTPIQDQAIDQILQGRDLLGIANTGTGKTGAFLIPLISKVLEDQSERVLIITPTRELALQIENEFKSLGRSFNIGSVLCIGGTSMFRQKRELERRVNFVIGTPGRLNDLINKKILNIADFKSVVVDEVDRMLDMGFIIEVKKILRNITGSKQSLFFSATISAKILELIQEFSNNLVTVSVKYSDTAKTIDQDIVRYEESNKLEVLHKLLNQEGFDKVLIFGRTKHGVRKLAEKLTSMGFRASSIHGNKSQPQRERALGQFRKNKLKVLVATDVVARGIDVDGITHVINYDLPATYEDYIHRIGRTGRANKIGKALTFVN